MWYDSFNSRNILEDSETDVFEKCNQGVSTTFIEKRWVLVRHWARPRGTWYREPLPALEVLWRGGGNWLYKQSHKGQMCCMKFTFVVHGVLCRWQEKVKAPPSSCMPSHRAPRRAKDRVCTPRGLGDGPRWWWVWMERSEQLKGYSGEEVTKIGDGPIWGSG